MCAAATTDIKMAEPGREVDHAFLRQVLRWIDRATDGATIAALLEGLRDYLGRHFAAEEAPGGLFERLVAETPRFSARVDALRAEHVSLLADVTRLQRCAPVTYHAPAAEILSEVHALVERLRAHEAAEDELLQESLEQDLGGQG